MGPEFIENYQQKTKKNHEKFSLTSLASAGKIIEPLSMVSEVGRTIGDEAFAIREFDSMALEAIAGDLHTQQIKRCGGTALNSHNPMSSFLGPFRP